MTSSRDGADESVINTQKKLIKKRKHENKEAALLWEDIYQDKRDKFIKSLHCGGDHLKDLSKKDQNLMTRLQQIKRKERIKRRIQNGLNDMMDCSIGEPDDAVNEQKQVISTNYEANPKVKCRSVLQ